MNSRSRQIIGTEPSVQSTWRALDDRFRVLICADSDMLAARLVGELTDFGPPLEHQRIWLEADLISAAAEAWDVVLVARCAQLGGRRVITAMATASVPAPVIVIADPDAEAAPLALVGAGAADYLLLDRLGRLGSAVRQAVEHARLGAEARRISRRLQRTGRLLRMSFDASTNALIAIDSSIGVMEWNSTAERLLGWSQDEVRGRPLPAVLGGEAAEKLVPAIAAAAPVGSTAGPVQATTVRRRDGRSVRVELAVASIGSSEGISEDSPAHLVTLTDISERWRMERLKDSRLGVLRALAEPSAEMALTGVLEQVAGPLGCDRGVLWEADARGSLHFRTSWAADPAVPVLPPGAADDMVQWVRTTGKFSFLDHDDASAIDAAAATGKPSRARVAFPLVHGQHIFGVIELSCYELPDVDDHILLLLSTVGAHTGTFLARKRSEAEFARSLEELHRIESDRKRLTHLLVQAQEDERRAIAADIHDDPLQVMSAVALRLHSLRRRLADSPSVQSLTVVEEMVASAVSRLRSMMFDLRPPALDRGHLAEPLRDRLEKARHDHGLEYVLTADEPDRLGNEARVILYRIAQEAIINVVKHAQATRVEVTLQPDGDGCLLRIADDGIGIDETLREGRPGHMGLRSMRERAELADGWLRIDANGDCGSVVSCWVPVRTAVDGRVAS